MTIFSYKRHVSYLCSVALPHGDVGWTAVCEYGISKSYSFTFEYVEIILLNCFEDPEHHIFQQNLQNRFVHNITCNM